MQKELIQYKSVIFIDVGSVTEIYGIIQEADKF